MKKNVLFEPTNIGKMKLKNRMVMAPMATKLANEMGAITERYIDFCVERAKNGVGLIIIENTCVDWPVGKNSQNPVSADDDKFIMGLNELAEEVHFYGAKIATQLMHAGRQTSVLQATEGEELVSASAIPCHLAGGDIPRTLTVEEILRVEDKFAQAARRTMQADFDAVELHGAHGYLFSQFMSPFTNKRTDEYGGSFENRMRFSLEVVRAIRKLVGDDFPIIFRLSAEEYVEGGLTLEDMKKAAQLLEKVGVDAFDVSTGIYETISKAMPAMGVPDAPNVHLSNAIKKVVKVPVIHAGKLGNPSVAERVLREGKADLISWGRSLLADPELPRKIAEDRLEEIRPCIYCNDCLSHILMALRIACSVNAELGRERTYCIRKTEKPKNVLIIGGGPAGMEAARVAALRGHKVDLYERSDKLGGQLAYASAPPFKAEIKGLIRYFEVQLEKLGVVSHLKTEVTKSLIETLMTDVAIVAIGASPFVPDIPGVQRDVVSTAPEVLVGEKETGQEVVIVGGGSIGCETARFLSEKGKRVTIVSRRETQKDVATDVNAMLRMDLLYVLRELGVEILLGKKVDGITDDGLTVLNKDKETEFLKANSVVLAMGMKSDNMLGQDLADVVPELYTIGDCVKPGRIFDAIHLAARVAMEI